MLLSCTPTARPVHMYALRKQLSSLLIGIALFIAIPTSVSHVPHSLSTSAITEVEVSEEDLDCLATNIYHESRGEGFYGMEAVARVTLNRLLSPGFPDTICKVVFQPRQFSWTASTRAVSDSAAYKQAVEIARFVLMHPEDDFTNGSLFFHTIHIRRPIWTKNLEQSLVVNNHIFYKERK